MTEQRRPDAEVDTLLSGGTPTDPDLAALTGVVSGIRGAYSAEPSDAHVAAFAGRLAAVAAAAPLDGGPVGASQSPRRLTRRLAAALAVAGVAVFGVAGAAAADEVDGAVSGDALYGLDRALERVGINDGGAVERLAEVRVLLERGDVELALATSEEAIEALEGEDELDEEDADALAGLLQAAESVLSEGSEQSHERRTQVADMLTFMAETELTGEDFGQAVAQHARGILEDDSDGVDAGDGGATPDVADAPGKSGDAPGRQDDAPVKSDDEPDPEDAKAPQGAGKPDVTGTGAPEGAGKPSDAGKPASDKD